MCVHQDKWVKGFGRTAFVYLPTWGVIVHGVQVRSLVDKPSIEALRNMQAGKGDAIVAQNHHGWGDATIAKISWLRVPRERTKLASIILEFTTPQAANLANRHGILWDSNLYQAVLYDRAIRVRQYFNYQQFRHIGTSSNNNNIRSQSFVTIGAYEIIEWPRNAIDFGYGVVFLATLPSR
jgi:hypothetical protein